MTREEALLKLLQVEPATKVELQMVTGWEIPETNAVLEKLLKDGKVTWINGGNSPGYRWYRPVA
jgi:predicted Rossmann fold nucleotide-binding protein DprA/Smf involved in DNA uptake